MEKIEASSSASKNIQIELGSIKSDRKVIALCFVGGKLSSGASSHHALARWKLLTLPSLIGGSHSVCASLEVESVSFSRSSENGPRQRTARRRSWAITRARVGGPSRDRACFYSRASTSLARRPLNWCLYFAAQWLACGLPCQRFVSHLAMRHA